MVGQSFKKRKTVSLKMRGVWDLRIDGGKRRGGEKLIHHILPKV